MDEKMIASHHLHIVELPPSSESCEEIKKPLSRPWRPSVFRIGPLIGLVALLFAFLQVFATCSILLASDGDMVKNWRYQPSVYLATLTAISNKCLQFATIQGTVVTFWLKAIKGTTLGQLHRDWGFGLYTYKALTAGRHFNLLAFACIAATFVVMDGPLLQRASTVHLSTVDHTFNLSVSITPEIPAYWTGTVGFYLMPLVESLQFQNHFLPVYYEFGAGAPMRGAIVGCPSQSTCRALVRGPALAVDNCTSVSEPRDFKSLMSKTQAKDFAQGCMWWVNFGPFSRPEEDQVVFKQKFSIFNGTTESFLYETTISDEDVARSCVGHVNTTSCYMVSAVGEYEVEITDGVVTFAEPPSYPRIVARANNTALTDKTVADFQLAINHVDNAINTTLGGIAEGAGLAYYTNEGLVTIPGENREVPSRPGLSPNPSLYTFQHITNYAEMFSSDADCAPAWRDPRDGIMAKLNELMFRTGVYVAQHYDDDYLRPLLDEGLESNSTVPGSLISPVEVFHSDMSYFAGAAAVQLLAILAILVTFYGWWDLGRSATLSPLEIAKAFDAPMLVDVLGNSSGNEIAKVEGCRKVKYGAISNGASEAGSFEPSERQRLGIADMEDVSKPNGHRTTLREHFCSFNSTIARRRKSVKRER
ncbi:uncharacterized protein LTR77_005916 [Saxophila tyrrhenica]|uniref:Uncharacterized protein n=1 Tax=Saxophila tyrrhenica TaxID=1690608 RepID=A0AAV9P9E2_9PEZI|nr:hypothetical protein LTR77_005916 [Saxophila tyrrhenica]